MSTNVEEDKIYRNYYRGLKIYNGKNKKKILDIPTPIFYEIQTCRFPALLKVIKIEVKKKDDNSIEIKYGGGTSESKSESIKKEMEEGLKLFSEYLLNKSNQYYNYLYVIQGFNYTFFFEDYIGNPGKTKKIFSKLKELNEKPKLNEETRNYYGLNWHDTFFLNLQASAGLDKQSFYDGLIHLITNENTFTYTYDFTKNIRRLNKPYGIDINTMNIEDDPLLSRSPSELSDDFHMGDVYKVVLEDKGLTLSGKKYIYYFTIETKVEFSEKYFFFRNKEDIIQIDIVQESPKFTIPPKMFEHYKYSIEKSILYHHELLKSFKFKSTNSKNTRKKRNVNENSNPFSAKDVAGMKKKLEKYIYNHSNIYKVNIRGISPNEFFVRVEPNMLFIEDKYIENKQIPNEILNITIDEQSNIESKIPKELLDQNHLETVLLNYYKSMDKLQVEALPITPTRFPPRPPSPLPRRKGGTGTGTGTYKRRKNSRIRSSRRFK